MKQSATVTIGSKVNVSKINIIMDLPYFRLLLVLCDCEWKVKKNAGPRFRWPGYSKDICRIIAEIIAGQSLTKVRQDIPSKVRYLKL